MKSNKCPSEPIRESISAATAESSSELGSELAGLGGVQVEEKDAGTERSTQRQIENSKPAPVFIDLTLSTGSTPYDPIVI